MPLITIETNQPLASDEILPELSKTIADMLGKPESYVMLKYKHNPYMLFAGTNKPLAHLELKSLGLPEDKTADFSSRLCSEIHQNLSILPDRIYIEFSAPERHMWGWNGSTF